MDEIKDKAFNVIVVFCVLMMIAFFMYPLLAMAGIIAILYLIVRILDKLANLFKKTPND